MLAITIWVLFIVQSFGKDLIPHTHQQILNENAESGTRLAYFDAKRFPNPHYKINLIYEQRKTNEITEIERIEEEIGKYMHHHNPSTTTTTTETHQNFEVVNEMEIKNTTNHRPSESPIAEQENRYHKHEEEEVTEIEQIEEEIIKYRHCYHPSTMITTTEAQYDVLNKKEIKDTSNINTSEMPNTELDKHEEKEATSTLPPMPLPPKLREPFIGVHPHFPSRERRPIPHRHPDHRLHIARTTSKNPVEEEARTELSPSVTQSDDITNDVTGSQSDCQDSHAYKPGPFTQRHPDHRLHTSRTTSEGIVEEEAQTELSPPVALSDEMRDITNYDAAGSNINRRDFSAFEAVPKPHRHPFHRLHNLRTTSEAPVKADVRTDLSPSVKQSDEVNVFPNKDVAESHLNRSNFLPHEPKPILHRHPVHQLHTSRTASAPIVEEEARTELSPPETQSDKNTTDGVTGSHLDLSNSLSHEPKPISHRHPNLRLHISHTNTESSVEEEVRRITSPPVTESDEMKEVNYDVPGSHLDRPNSSSYEPRPVSNRYPDHQLHISRITSQASVEEEIRTVVSPPFTKSDEMQDISDYDGAGSHLNHQDLQAFEPRPIPHRRFYHRLHVSHTTSETSDEVKARTNLDSTEKRIHLSQTLHNPSFRRNGHNALAKIRPGLYDIHRSIGPAPRPVYRGNYKFSWADINDMHTSTAPKVSQLKENPAPPPVPPHCPSLV